MGRQKQQLPKIASQLRRAIMHLISCQQEVLIQQWSELVPKQVYVASCRLVLRLVVLAFGQAKGVRVANEFAMPHIRDY